MTFVVINLLNNSNITFDLLFVSSNKISLSDDISDNLLFLFIVGTASTFFLNNFYSFLLTDNFHKQLLSHF